MTALYLLDTNLVSELAKQAPDAGVEEKLVAHQFSCAIAAPTVEELSYGVARLPASLKRDMLERWLEGILNRFVLLPFEARAALWLGRERARLSARGLPAPRTDGEIAAVAVAHGLTLVTRNVGDFANFDGLRLENWFRGEKGA